MTFMRDIHFSGEGKEAFNLKNNQTGATSSAMHKWLIERRCGEGKGANEFAAHLDKVLEVYKKAAN